MLTNYYVNGATQTLKHDYSIGIDYPFVFECFFVPCLLAISTYKIFEIYIRGFLISFLGSFPCVPLLPFFVKMFLELPSFGANLRKAIRSSRLEPKPPLGKRAHSLSFSQFPTDYLRNA